MVKILLRRKARCAARASKWDCAASYYKKLCLDRFDNVSDAIQLGHAFKESGNMDAAQSAYLRAADLHPYSVDAQWQAGLFLKRIGSNEEAASYFARVHILDNSFKDIYQQLFEVGIRGRKALDAIMLKSMLIGSNKLINPISMFLKWRIKGALRKAKGSSKKRDWIAAEQAYRLILKRAPRQPRFLTQLGHALREQGKLEEALLIYWQTLLLTPRDPDLYIHIGHTFKALRRVDSALEAYLISWRLQPNQPHVLQEIRALRGSVSRESLDYACKDSTEVNKKIHNCYQTSAVDSLMPDRYDSFVLNQFVGLDQSSLHVAHILYQLQSAILAKRKSVNEIYY
ncbi:MAG: tetratricopeptide repeat protein [Legionella sp.]|nr:tetratricopeptide repeat protein [Legionella sp.]